MTDSSGPLPPDQRFVLRRLARGGTVWILEGEQDEAQLRVGDRIYRLLADDVETLVRRGLIRPATVSTWTRYELTDAGRDMLAE